MAYTTIDDPSEYFTITTYAGNGSSSQTVTNSANSGDFQPDWLWIKNRTTDGNNHLLFNSQVGMPNHLSTDLDYGEATATNKATALQSNGFLVSSSHSSVNAGSNNYVAWQWKLNAGSNTSHSAGDNSATEASVSQANASTGVSIVTYTGDTSGHGSTYPSTFNHGLGLTPRMIWVKERNASSQINWAVYHADLNPGSSYNHFLEINTYDAIGSANNAHWGGNTMTLNSNLFSAGSSNLTGANGQNYIAFLFADVKGYQKIGSYVGNGSTNGPVIYTGFKPAYVLTKGINQNKNWDIYDTARTPINEIKTNLSYDNDNEDYVSGTYNAVDFLSNGFKIRNNNSTNNNNGSRFLYWAIAENPFVSSEGVPTTAR